MSENLIKIAQISSPGKIILCGEHAVVYGQDAIALAIGLRCHATIYQIANDTSEQNGTLTFTGTLNCTVNLKYHHEILDQDTEKVSECEIIKQKINMFLEQTNKQITLDKNYLIQVQSQIPIGKCLGSSAAFNTVLATSFLILINYPNKIDVETEKQRINNLSKKFQSIQHGTPSGIDNFVATYGGVVLFNPSKQPKFTKINDESVLHKLSNQIGFTLIDTGLGKNTKQAVSIVKENCQKNPECKQMIKQIGTFAKTIINLLKEQKQVNQSQEEEESIIKEQTERNLQQLKQDSQKPIEQIENSPKSEDKTWQQHLFSIMSRNHHLLRSLGVSHETIEQIVSQTTPTKNSSAKITGSGMGGFVLIAHHKQTHLGAQGTKVTVGGQGVQVGYL